MRWLESLGEWLDRRLQLSGVIRETLLHRVPRSSASWWYVFGSAALAVFILQVVTGILLALVYVPSAAEAWNSLQTLNHTIALGWFLRALHGWGSNFMLALVLIHMIQVFLFGAYKYPREFTWVVGIFLLLMTLGMAFTGQVLRFDQDAYWGLGIGASIMSRTPLIGGWLVNLLLGGPIIAGATLSRFFALHVFVIPGTLIGLVGSPSAHGAQARNQRMAHARTTGAARDLSEGVRGTDPQGWRAFRSGRHLEGPDLRCLHPAGCGSLRRYFRTLWTDGPTGPHHHPNRSKTGFLFSVVVRRSLLAAAAA